MPDDIQYSLRYSFGISMLNDIHCTVQYSYGFYMADEIYCTIQLWFTYARWYKLYCIAVVCLDKWYIPYYTVMVYLCHSIYTALSNYCVSLPNNIHFNVQLWLVYAILFTLYCTAVVCLSRMKCTVLYMYSCDLSITDEMHCTVHVQLWFVYHWWNALYCTCTALVCLSLMKCTVLYMYSCGLSITDEMHCTVNVQLWFVYGKTHACIWCLLFGIKINLLYFTYDKLLP
jgi:hypothetical protein